MAHLTYRMGGPTGGEMRALAPAARVILLPTETHLRAERATAD